MMATEDEPQLNLGQGEINNVPGNDTKERPTPSKLITMTNSFPEPTNEYPGEKLLTGIEVCLASRVVPFLR